MLFFLLGRWIGTTLMVRFRPQDMLVFYGVANVLLCIFVCIVGGKAAVFAMMGISFFMSIMYPTQFSLALTDLKGDTKSGSAFLVMAIVGGALMPPLQGLIIDQQEILGWPAVNVSFILPLISFILITVYGYQTYKKGTLPLTPPC
jgi:FHS family L-fucose permease-like MFS transporter